MKFHCTTSMVYTTVYSFPSLSGLCPIILAPFFSPRTDVISCNGIEEGGKEREEEAAGLTNHLFPLGWARVTLLRIHGFFFLVSNWPFQSWIRFEVPISEAPRFPISQAGVRKVWEPPLPFPPPPPFQKKGEGGERIIDEKARPSFIDDINYSPLLPFSHTHKRGGQID